VFPISLAEMLDAWRKHMLSTFKRKVGTTLAVGTGAVLTAAPAFASGPTLPDIGVDVSGYVTVGILAIGGVIGAAIGGFFAFLLVRSGAGWASKLLGGKS
jgi:hypothetical protein